VYATVLDLANTTQTGKQIRNKLKMLQTDSKHDSTPPSRKTCASHHITSTGVEGWGPWRLTRVWDSRTGILQGGSSEHWNSLVNFSHWNRLRFFLTGKVDVGGTLVFFSLSTMLNRDPLWTISHST